MTHYCVENDLGYDAILYLEFFADVRCKLRAVIGVYVLPGVPWPRPTIQCLYIAEMTVSASLSAPPLYTWRIRLSFTVCTCTHLFCAVVLVPLGLWSGCRWYTWPWGWYLAGGLVVFSWVCNPYSYLVTFLIGLCRWAANCPPLSGVLWESTVGHDLV